MNFSKSLFKRSLAGVTALTGAAMFGAVHAQPTVNPNTHPPATLAPYVLQNTDLERSATRAYRPWFENGAWTGDLIEYTISADGQRSTDVTVGLFPPENGVENWSARANLPSRDEDGELVPAEEDFWQQRNLFTVKRCLDSENCSGDRSQIPFWWDRLSEAQRELLDPDTFEDEDATGAQDSALLNFLRGDRSGERDQEGGRFRLRYSLMSDVINSRPAYVPAGDSGLVLVGTNGGMLQAFDAANGEEMFGYVPSMLIDKLFNLARSPYRHTYFVDGELRGRSIPDGNDDRHIVAGGLGAGAPGIFALDVTDPENPVVLFERSASDDDIGHIYGRPGIARLPDGEWYVVTGNGYLSGSETAKLLLYPIDGGSPTVINAGAAADNGLSAPALVDATGNGRVDYAYAGDLRGNLWRFNLDNGTSTQIFQGNQNRPITVEPDVARHPTGSGLMVFFGTGSLLSAADLDNTEEQAIFGIWDRFGDSPLVLETDLLTQNLDTLTETWGDVSRTVRVVTDDNEPVWSGNDRHLGWKVALPGEGERLVGHPQIRGGRIQFVTLNPSQRDDNGVRVNDSWIMQLRLASGGSSDRALFDLDRDGELTDDDAVTIEDETVYPIGLRFGPGNIAQPAFARVIQDIDAVFINALLLPEPIEPDTASLVFGGNINVTTDSPNGPLVKPDDGYAGDDGRTTDRDLDARGPMNPFLRADGIGGRPDGHHHSYDKVHGVNYIDYFGLEPRRGKLSLNVGSEPYEVEQELNRVTEVGIDEDQKFIVVLTNADLSQGAEIQIGCRTWDVYEYQWMMARHVIGDTEPRDMLDQNGRPLIFSLRDIAPDSGACDNGKTPTLRITMTDRVGREDVLHGTLPGCVVNSHDYDGKTELDGSLTEQDPHWWRDGNKHITENREGFGYRWRNGALTMQLLAVDEDGSKAYERQEYELPRLRNNRDMPPDSPAAIAQGDGGIFAKAFEQAGQGNERRLVPVTGDNQSGLLYESSIFWNFGDMWQFQQQGQAARCYGASGYNAALSNEVFGLNRAQYDGLVSDLRQNETLQQEYAQLLSDLAEAAAIGDEEGVRRALEALNKLFTDNPSVGSWGAHKDLTLQDYHRLRSYAHGDQFTNLDLLEIDRNLFDGAIDVELDVDGTPADVRDIELDLLPAAGPNYRAGRRAWIDLLQD